MRKILLSLVTTFSLALVIAALPAPAEAWCYRWDGHCVLDWYGASYGAWTPYYSYYGAYDYATTYSYPYYPYDYSYAYPYGRVYLYGY
jgi:hypothetical protein